MSSETITRNDLTNILNEIVAIDGTDMTAQEISDFVDSLNVTGIHAVDYIVEQGTDGIWTYRKWNSGIAECWGKSSVASNTYNASGGQKNVVVTFPFTFSSAPSVNVSGNIAGDIHTDIGFTESGVTNAQTYLVNRATSSVTATGTVYWYAIGAWK